MIHQLIVYENMDTRDDDKLIRLIKETTGPKALAVSLVI